MAGMGKISKKITKVFRNNSFKGNNNKPRFWKKTSYGYGENNLELDCSSTANQSTQSLLDQLQEAQSSATHLTLIDSLQRPDNALLFRAVQDLVTNKDSSTNSRMNLKQITLKEPHVDAGDYKRWLFKKTNFLHRVYKQCKEQNIKIKIQATMIFATPEDKQQDIGPWLSHLQDTIPQDPDITSLKLNLHDVPTQADHEYTAAVPQVFAALMQLFDNDLRVWDLCQVHVLYTTVPKYGVKQTQALFDIADAFDIPLQIKWQPLDDTKRITGTWIRNTRQAQHVLAIATQQQRKAKAATASAEAGAKQEIEDTTASTVCEGSSGQLLGS